MIKFKFWFKSKHALQVLLKEQEVTIEELQEERRLDNKSHNRFVQQVKEEKSRELMACYYYANENNWHGFIGDGGETARKALGIQGERSNDSDVRKRDQFANRTEAIFKDGFPQIGLTSNQLYAIGCKIYDDQCRY